ncbi:Hypothetical protein D9617_6g092760 [Elsinoe fawcettii]|nr:Hypothetical protein D9617_6g092760 [Elsinoe fawcettii]
MSSPLSAGDIIAIIEKLKEFYDTIKGTDERVKTATMKILKQEDDVRFIDSVLKKNSSNILDTETQDQINRIRALLDKVTKSVQKVLELNNLYNKERESTAFSVIYRTRFNWTGKVKDLESVCDAAASDIGTLHRWLSSLSFSYLSDMRFAKPVQGDATGLTRPVALVRDAISIIFIDKDNNGRSKIAEAYANLINHWTSDDSQKWPVKEAHSAGLKIKWQNQCVDHCTKVGIKVNSDGKGPPENHAMKALFERGEFTGQPFNQQVYDAISLTRSRGLPDDLFRRYKYVITFTPDLRKTLMELKEEMATSSPDAVSRDTGHIKILGTYGDEKNIKILHPTKIKEPEGNVDNWRSRITLIRDAYKNFLTQEVEWTPPVRAPAQATP